MRGEIETIEKKKTWELVKPSEKRKPTSVKWVYRIKRNSKGEVTIFKAHFVAKCYIQKKGVDYNEVFSPVARVESIQILLALTTQFKWNLHHLDVKSSVVNGEIKEEVYVAQLKALSRRERGIMSSC